ncbi:MAG: hydantoinase B/oxoprolinase family protein [Proteobacteria bacterium]|nr:hydantoinase B/oxoprolinase family protein [Pseudomonadota bacterium]MBU1716990.1 hydantoinase B/oxoprolinase family protein [Pseudomonadota bacterium]
MPVHDKFRFAIDRGGTFTDIYAEVPGNPGFRVLKLLSEDPQNYPDAPREGIRRILEEVGGKTIPPDAINADQIEYIRMGTTVATNALLERQGSRCGLLITKGFRDLLQIGNQNRPRIFDLEIKKPELLYEKVVEINERVVLLKDEQPNETDEIVRGLSDEYLKIIHRPNLDQIKKDLLRLKKEGIESIAVVCMHAYIFPDHERQIGLIARQLGFRQVSISSEIMPMIKIVSRGDTTVVDAYLTPHIHQYIENFRNGFSDLLQHVNLQFMRSDGGLTPADNFSGSKAILSGPAGGVIGYAATTINKLKPQPVIGFDMGGTSTDVSRYDGQFALVHETETAGTRIQAPQLDIITVAAGGGSRLFFRHNMFEVGPESAGSHPGPVCYRKDGQLTITDANLVLGRLLPDFFPKIFGPGGKDALDLKASRKAFCRMRDEINQYRNTQNIPAMTLEQVAYGFIQVANETMARPMREISTARGYDIKEHVLACFGGAGGQHACAIARNLEITEIFIHRFAGILSAYGLGMADVIEDQQEPAALIYTQDNLSDLNTRLARLATSTKQKLTDQGFADEQIETTFFLNLRYQGTDTSLMIQKLNDQDYETSFRNHYLREFGFDLENRPIIVDNVRVQAKGLSPHLAKVVIDHKKTATNPVAFTSCYFANGFEDTPVFKLAELGAEEILTGPAIIIHDTSTIVLEPECTALITENGDIRITLANQRKKEISSRIDPVQLAIFSNLFMSIAEQMGRTLQRTAISTNIKERHDFSCALFDHTGALVANAPHQPVHLGAMSEAVRQQIKIHGTSLKEGDVLLTNHPLTGGSHLPDLTVISPIIKNGEPVFFVANRGHHADVGGISPGSMPPFSHKLADEGICIKSFKLVVNHIFQEEGIITLLTDPGPNIIGTRTLTDNISDLKAQVAANRRGITLLTEIVARYSLNTVQKYMEHVQSNAEHAVRQMLKKLAADTGQTTLQAVDYLDDGSPIKLKITIAPETGGAIFDFSGTAPELTGNCNAPKAVSHSAIIYVLRCLIKEEIPLNQGCLRPIRIIIPAGSLLAPSEKAAVVGGNVLTSQRIVDVILKAFKAAAASQGCMNNLTFGNASFGYYETIGGGAGAGPGWHGQSGVHTHMTNTRITDPEVLEKRYPVILKEFSLRPNSGGQGQFNGGEGLIREIEFTTPMQAAILSERRINNPYGLKGGKPGAKGQNIFIRKNQEPVDIGGKNEIVAQPGDRLRIMTPGGGGYSKKGN